MSNHALSQAHVAQRDYAPKGVDKRRVPIALMPQERLDLEALAARDGRSLAAMGRVVLLRGLAAMQQDQGASAPAGLAPNA